MPALVTAVIKPHKLDDVRAALREAGIDGLTVTEVQGYGRQGGKTETFRGTEYQVDFLPKVKLEVVVADDAVDRVLDLVTAAAATGKIGDGKLWAVDLGRVRRIRTREEGDEAL